MTTATSPNPRTSKTRQGRDLRVALFNPQGGVGKTTTTFNLGWMLASRGLRVVLVDADPQCNLSGLVLGYQGEKAFESFYENQPERNIRAGLAPAFESRPKEIEAIDCVSVAGNPNLSLLPGHIRLTEYEVSLGIAQSGTIPTLHNLPGSLSSLLEKTGRRYRADYLLIDMNPSLSSINENLVMTSNYFLVPARPRSFAVTAIDSLTYVLPRWKAWSEKAGAMPVFRDAVYPFPATDPKFLGTVIQKSGSGPQAHDGEEGEGTPSGGTPADGFQRRIDEINATVRNKFVPMLRKHGMMLDQQRYRDRGIGDDFCLASIPDFHGLIAMSRQHRVPVFSLTEEQIGPGGWKSKELFESIYAELADTIIELTSDAEGS